MNGNPRDGIVALATGRSARLLTVGSLALAAGSCAFLAVALLPAQASAQAKLEARYRVTLAGLPIGSGGWTVDVSGKRYAMEANGQTSGLASVFASGSGVAAARGVVNGNRLMPNAFSLSIKTRNNLDRIRVALAGGTVKSLSIEPPLKPSPNREPLTDAHKRGVLDPISAGVLPSVGRDGVAPEVCRGTLPVFDGKQRFDLELSFKRMENVKSERGYSGPVVVCAVKYTPLGGFYHGRSTTRFLRETRDIEVWYAPIAGTPLVAAYRVALPTFFGAAVLQATHFETTDSRRAEGGEADSR